MRTRLEQRGKQGGVSAAWLQRSPCALQTQTDGGSGCPGNAHGNRARGSAADPRSAEYLSKIVEDDRCDDKQKHGPETGDTLVPFRPNGNGYFHAEIDLIFVLAVEM